MLPTCSIVINNHNYGRFLGEAIDSALATGVEVVVVDDGSTDDSIHVIKRYGGRIRAIQQQDNRGQAAAINSGVAAATGDVVLLLDSDDKSAPNRAERVAESFRSEDVQWVRHDMVYFDDQGEHGRAYGYVEGMDPAMEFESTGRVLGSTSGSAFRRSFLQTLGPIPEDEFRVCADFYLFSVGAIAGGSRTLGDPLTLRRMHGDQLTRRLPRDPDSMVYEARQKASMAMHARTLAKRFGTMPSIQRGETWWQQKWLFDYLRFQGRRREAWRAWASHLFRLGRAPLTPSRKAAEAARSTLLAVIPRSAYPRVWWATHTGRTGVVGRLGGGLTNPRR